MPLPNIVQSELESNGIHYKILETESVISFYQDAINLQISLENLARGIVVQANGQKRMLVLRAADMLDFSALINAYGSSIDIVHNFQCDLPDCETDSRIPVPKLQKLEIVVDEALLKNDLVYFDAGIKGCYIKVNGEDFRELHSNSNLGNFSFSVDKLKHVDPFDNSADETLHSFTPKRIQQRVEETLDLPAMPAIAEEVMRIRVDPMAGARDLAKIVSRDPSLSAQVISWASSPYYGYQGKIDSIETAISRVLGFDLVLNLALGISVGKTLNVATDGPLGLHSYWRQSVYTATLCEKLCGFIKSKDRPQRGLVYLAGLLHNFGQLLLGHLFPAQFYLINRYSEMNPHIPISDIEHHLLDTSHVEIGAWLMESWNMPEELTAAVKWHHKEMTEGENAVYSNIVLIANRLLKRIDIGDSTQLVLPGQTMELLGLDEQDANNALNLIIEDGVDLDAIARQMVA
ncbi:MAG: HDOD domain-containing protein [Gammaproteobacteria bacterium]|nr:HDOD domain-containing protein [Gammaproteobacteria bacterium]